MGGIGKREEREGCSGGRVGGVGGGAGKNGRDGGKGESISIIVIHFLIIWIVKNLFQRKEKRGTK